MASGDSLFTLTAQNALPPGTLYATQDTIADASTPTATIPVLDFDGSTAEHADWLVAVPSQYGSTTGFTFQGFYASDGTNSGTVKWDLRVLQLNDLDILTGDLGIDGLTAASVTDTVPGTPINKLNVTATFALAKADAGTPAVGDLLYIRASRDTGTDTLADDAQLLGFHVTET